jgi:hypothetical protein
MFIEIAKPTVRPEEPPSSGGVSKGALARKSTVPRGGVGAGREVWYGSTVADQSGEARGKRVTRDVSLSAVTDLLERPPRATVAFVDHDRVGLLPVRARVGAGGHLFGVLPDAAPDLEGREVVLVVDDGPYWFELRGVSVRGVAARVAPPGAGDARSLVWYAIEPRRVLAWDYGAIREE